MIGPGEKRICTFVVTIWGGSSFRRVIDVVLLLLPLPPQLGLNSLGFKVGLILIAVFVGNLKIKPPTTLILKCFGFRRVLFTSW